MFRLANNYRLTVIFNITLCSVVISLLSYNASITRNGTLKTQVKISSNHSIKNPMKYILLWTKSKYQPFVYFGEGNSVFINKSCKWTNCYVTQDRNFLRTLTDFDIIAFNGPQIPLLEIIDDFPQERSYKQKYVYANIESYKNYPYKSNKLDGFFNWTWTYKLKSDAVWGYLVVRDANKNVIGPREYMQWIDINSMDPIDRNFNERLKSKKRAAAWFCSNCFTSSEREHFVKAVQHFLSRYKLNVDVYGDCGDFMCPKKMMKNCLRMLRKTYYFYFAFENSICEDYITEKVLYALKYDTVPVVYGGANYSRFMPDGIYLDAKKLGAKKLAETMYKLINDPEAYGNFFRWKKYYSFHATHESPDTDSYCEFCSMVNNKTLMREHKVYKHFNLWWMDNNMQDN